MNQQMVVVYDIRQDSVPGAYLLGILVPFAAAVLFAAGILYLYGFVGGSVGRGAASQRTGWMMKILQSALAATVCILMTLEGFNGCSDYRRALAQLEQATGWLESGNYQVVEGKVANFHPMPRSGHTNEGFSVQGVRFAYSDYDLSQPGFRNTASHGGPIREGLYVRVAHHEGRILKLEVRK